MGHKSLNVFCKTLGLSEACVYTVYHLGMWPYKLFGCYIFVFPSFLEVHQEKLHKVFLEDLLIGSVFSIL